MCVKIECSNSLWLEKKRKKVEKGKQGIWCLVQSFVHDMQTDKQDRFMPIGHALQNEKVTLCATTLTNCKSGL